MPSAEEKKYLQLRQESDDVYHFILDLFAAKSASSYTVNSTSRLRQRSCQNAMFSQDDQQERVGRYHGIVRSAAGFVKSKTT